jgi:hypothetical protein
VELTYSKELDKSGISVRGLARLVGCGFNTVHNAVQGANPDDVLEAEILTADGLQGANFILERGVIQVLETLMQGRHKAETKAAALNLYRKYAIAGFKLHTMLECAPERLKEMVDAAQPIADADRLQRQHAPPKSL